MTHDIYKYRPYVSLRVSASIDGKFATGDFSGQEILGEEARSRVQAELAKSDAIVTGIETILKEDPILIPQGEGLIYQGVRIILDTHLRIPLTAQVVTTKWQGDVWIFTSPQSDRDKKTELEALGIKVFDVDITNGKHISLPFVLEDLANAGIKKLAVNAGPSLSSSFLKMKVWDELLLFRAPFLIGAGGKDAFGELDVTGPDKAIGLDLINLEQVGSDMLEIYRPVRQL